MIGLLLCLIVLSSGSALGSLFNKRYEEIFPITVLSIIVYLYIFYLFDLLFLGYYLLLCLIMIIYIIFFYKLIKSSTEIKKNVFHNFFTPGFIIFLIVYIILFFITNNREVLLWDELRLWGAYPKILYYNGSLQLGKNALLLEQMQSYEPAMPLFQFFIQKLLLQYKESHLFFAYALLGVTAFMPLTKGITYKKWHNIPLMVCLIILLPLILSNSNHDSLIYYKTLFIDPIIGIFFCFALYLSLNTSMNRKIRYMTFLLSLSVLTLFKDIGIIFAVASALSFIAIEFFVQKNKKIIYLITPLLVIGLVFGSWKLVQNIVGTPNIYTDNITLNSLKDLVINPNENQKIIIKNYLNQFNNGIIYQKATANYNKFLTSTNLIILLTILFISLVIIKPKGEKSKIIITYISYLIGCFTFFLGLILVYIFSIKGVPSFLRYVSTIFVTGFMLLYFIIVNDFIKNSDLNKKYKLFMIIVLFISFMIFPFKNKKLNNEEYLENIKEESHIYSEVLKKEIKQFNENSFALVFTNSVREKFEHVAYHHHIYLNLVENNVKYTYDSVISISDKESEKQLFYKWLEKYDYVYFICVDDLDNDVYNKFLKNPIDKSELFKINKNSNKIKLELVS